MRVVGLQYSPFYDELVELEQEHFCTNDFTQNRLKTIQMDKNMLFLCYARKFISMYILLCVLPSLNKGFTYLLTYLLTYILFRYLQGQQESKGAAILDGRAKPGRQSFCRF